MRASVLQSLISSFDGIAVDEGVRQQFKDVVRQVGQAYGYSMADRNERVLFARQLLDRGISRPTIRDRLMAHFEISKPQAYRVIGEALQLSQNCSGFDTRKRSNPTIETHSGANDEET